MPLLGMSFYIPENESLMSYTWEVQWVFLSDIKEIESRWVGQVATNTPVARWFDNLIDLIEIYS